MTFNNAKLGGDDSSSRAAAEYREDMKVYEKGELHMCFQFHAHLDFPKKSICIFLNKTFLGVALVFHSAVVLNG